jgi:hypothetical protein
MDLCIITRGRKNQFSEKFEAFRITFANLTFPGDGFEALLVPQIKSADKTAIKT